MLQIIKRFQYYVRAENPDYDADETGSQPILFGGDALKIKWENDVIPKSKSNTLKFDDLMLFSIYGWLPPTGLKNHVDALIKTTANEAADQVKKARAHGKRQKVDKARSSNDDQSTREAIKMFR